MLLDYINKIALYILILYSATLLSSLINKWTVGVHKIDEYIECYAEWKQQGRECMFYDSIHIKFKKASCSVGLDIGSAISHGMGWKGTGDRMKRVQRKFWGW